MKVRAWLAGPLFGFTVGSIRFWLGLILMTSGLCKLTEGHFPQIIGPPLLEKQLATYGLGLYARFIAFSQVIIGFLLINKRFATVGAVMAFPMLLNILVVVIALNWRGTPYVVGFFLSCNVLLLAYDFHKLKFLLTDDTSALRRLPVRRSNWRMDAASLLVLVVIVAGAALWKGQAETARYIINAGVLALAVLGVYTVVLQWREKKRAGQLASYEPPAPSIVPSYAESH